MAKRRTHRKSNPELAVCGGTKRNGDPCLREQGWGTDHPGYGRCKHHGGASPTGSTAAAREEVGAMAVSLDVTPAEAVLGTMRLAAGQLAYATWKVGQLDDVMTEQGGLQPWYRIQLACEDRLVKFAAAAAGMGVEERKTKLLEEQTRQLGAWLEAVVEAVGLTPAQRKLLGPAIREQLTAGSPA